MQFPGQALMGGYIQFHQLQPTVLLLFDPLYQRGPDYALGSTGKIKIDQNRDSRLQDLFFKIYFTRIFFHLFLLPSPFHHTVDTRKPGEGNLNSGPQSSKTIVYQAGNSFPFLSNSTANPRDSSVRPTSTPKASMAGRARWG